MVREIEFRAKKKYANEWVYGSGVIPVFENGYKTNKMKIVKKVHYDELSNYEAEYVSFEIKPETISQYTGLEDKDGVKIFEGDIVKFVGRCTNKLGFANAIVVFHETEFAFYINERYYSIFSAYCELYEVIGNIYDNKELLENA